MEFLYILLLLSHKVSDKIAFLINIRSLFRIDSSYSNKCFTFHVLINTETIIKLSCRRRNRISCTSILGEKCGQLFILVHVKNNQFNMTAQFPNFLLYDCIVKQ